MLALREGAPLLARALSEVEAEIEGGWTAAASGYREIRHYRLYLQDERYHDFEAYCRDRWAINRDTVDKMILALEVVEVLTKNFRHLEPPANAGQATALLPLKETPEQMAAALQEAQTEAKANHKKLTAQRIGAAVRKRLPADAQTEDAAAAATVAEDEGFDQTRRDLERTVVALAGLSQGLSRHVDCVDFTIHELQQLRELVSALSERATRGGRLLEAVTNRRTKRNGAPMPRVRREQGAGGGLQKHTLLQALGAHGPSTTRELMPVTGLDMYVASSRMSELIREGLVIDTGQRRAGQDGRPNKVYALSPQEARP